VDLQNYYFCKLKNNNLGYMSNWPKKHHSKKPNLKFYSVFKNNETNPMNPNKTLYNVELILVDNLKSNKRIGTGMVVGTNSNAVTTQNMLFFSEFYTLCFPNGTITAVAAGTNTTQPNGVFDTSQPPVVESIVCGS
jgi:hypothetical protein